MILPHRANPAGWNFREPQVRVAGWLERDLRGYAAVHDGADRGMARAHPRRLRAADTLALPGDHAAADTV